MVLLASSMVGENSPALASEAKPRCTAANQGMFWPEEANHNAQSRRLYARQGSLELCQISGWRYRWRPLGTNVSQWVKPANPPGTTSR